MLPTTSPRFAFRISSFGFLALALSALQACAPKPKPAPITPTGPDPMALENEQHNKLILKMSTDPCAENLQNLGSALTVFYRETGGFPEALHTLLPVAKAYNLKVQFTCPESGEPYVYVPAGLSSPGSLRRLVLYDKTPVHDGWRWGVVMSPPLQGMTNVIPEVIYISQPVLDAYLKSAPAP